MKFKKNSLWIYSGPFLRLTITEGTDLKETNIIYDDDHPQRREDFKNDAFEFVRGDYDGWYFFSPGLALNAGITLLFEMNL